LILLKPNQFARILITFAQISPKFAQNLAEISPNFAQKNFLGDAAASLAHTALMLLYLIANS